MIANTSCTAMARGGAADDEHQTVGGPEPVLWLITYASGERQYVHQKPAVWPTPDCKITEYYDRPAAANASADSATPAAQREASAQLIEAMLEHEPRAVYGSRHIRLALTMAARAVRRGRHLTAREQLINLACNLEMPIENETDEERTANAALAARMRSVAG